MYGKEAAAFKVPEREIKDELILKQTLPGNCLYLIQLVDEKGKIMCIKKILKM
jgi:hypothetical protein